MGISLNEFRSVFICSVEAVLDKRNIEIGDSLTFEDIGLDSLDRMNLLLDLEERLQLDLAALDLGEVNTIKRLHKKIHELQSV